jgi:hypothetical protein
MRRDDFPTPVSDPAAAGLPEYADDDSTADERVPSVREADGPDPAPLPPDREDGPLALDEYGTTAEEQRRGEPLEGRIAREEPEVSYAVSGGQVGRLVQPDQGAHEDTEADEVAVDAGPSGGGASAEEAAMHEIADDDI